VISLSLKSFRSESVSFKTHCRHAVALTEEEGLGGAARTPILNHTIRMPSIMQHVKAYTISDEEGARTICWSSLISPVGLTRLKDHCHTGVVRVDVLELEPCIGGTLTRLEHRARELVENRGEGETSSHSQLQSVLSNLMSKS
jgi:hypothetical protein